MFRAVLLVRSFTKPVARNPKSLTIVTGPQFAKINLSKDDVLFNVVTEESALKRKDSDFLWRGPKEKSQALMELLIGGLTPENGIICDLSPGTGKSFIPIFSSP